MKYLFLTIVVLVLVLGTFNVAAQQTPTTQDSVQVDITKLTSSQLQVWQELKQQQAQANSVTTTLDNLSPDKLDHYAQVGKAFGEAFKECWSTVSTDAEKFAQSPAGKWTMVLISWKIMGRDAIDLTRSIVQWTLGGFLYFIGVPIWGWVIWRNCVKRPIASIEHTGFFKKKIIYSNQEPIHANIIGGYALFFMLYLILVGIITFLH